MKKQLELKDKIIEVAGQMLVLMPERSLFYVDEQALLVADIHVGKDTTFRRSGISVPEAVADADFLRLSRAIDRMAARQLIVLGDFQHARMGMTARTNERILRWRAQHPKLSITLIMGNHDRASGKVPGDWNFDVINGAMQLGPFTLTHEPPAKRTSNSICGHVHPSVRLFGRGGQSEKLSCFFLDRKLLILPAFGSFTGTKKMEPDKHSVAYAIAGNAILECRQESSKAKGKL